MEQGEEGVMLVSDQRGYTSCMKDPLPTANLTKNGGNDALTLIAHRCTAPQHSRVLFTLKLILRSLRHNQSQLVLKIVLSGLMSNVSCV